MKKHEKHENTPQNELPAQVFFPFSLFFFGRALGGSGRHLPESFGAPGALPGEAKAKREANRKEGKWGGKGVIKKCFWDLLGCFVFLIVMDCSWRCLLLFFCCFLQFFFGKFVFVVGFVVGLGGFLILFKPFF